MDSAESRYDRKFFVLTKWNTKNTMWYFQKYRKL